MRSWYSKKAFVRSPPRLRQSQDKVPLRRTQAEKAKAKERGPHKQHQTDAAQVPPTGGTLDTSQSEAPRYLPAAKRLRWLRLGAQDGWQSSGLLLKGAGCLVRWPLNCLRCSDRPMLVSQEAQFARL